MPYKRGPYNAHAGAGTNAAAGGLDAAPAPAGELQKLQTQNKTATDTIKRLKDQVADLEAQVSRLNSEVQTIQSNVQLQIDNAKLRAQVKAAGQMMLHGNQQFAAGVAAGQGRKTPFSAGASSSHSLFTPAPDGAQSP